MSKSAQRIAHQVGVVGSWCATAAVMGGLSCLVAPDVVGSHSKPVHVALRLIHLDPMVLGWRGLVLLAAVTVGALALPRRRARSGHARSIAPSAYLCRGTGTDPTRGTRPGSAQKPSVPSVVRRSA